MPTKWMFLISVLHFDLPSPLALSPRAGAGGAGFGASISRRVPSRAASPVRAGARPCARAIARLCRAAAGEPRRQLGAASAAAAVVASTRRWCLVVVDGEHTGRARRNAGRRDLGHRDRARAAHRRGRPRRSGRHVVDERHDLRVHADVAIRGAQRVECAYASRRPGGRCAVAPSASIMASASGTWR